MSEDIVLNTTKGASNWGAFFVIIIVEGQKRDKNKKAKTPTT